MKNFLKLIDEAKSRYKLNIYRRSAFKLFKSGLISEEEYFAILKSIKNKLEKLKNGS